METVNTSTPPPSPPPPAPPAPSARRAAQLPVADEQHWAASPLMGVAVSPSVTTTRRRLPSPPLPLPSLQQSRGSGPRGEGRRALGGEGSPPAELAAAWDQGSAHPIKPGADAKRRGATHGGAGQGRQWRTGERASEMESYGVCVSARETGSRHPRPCSSIVNE